VFACARRALLDDREIDVEGGVSIAHEVLTHIIEESDRVVFGGSQGWLGDHERRPNNA
jgi:hypothetical protein